jgi:hypothetical protein
MSLYAVMRRRPAGASTACFIPTPQAEAWGHLPTPSGQQLDCDPVASSNVPQSLSGSSSSHLLCR